MIDLHTHTFFSDGVLIPSELVRRAEDRGYKAIAITDHVDMSNMDFVIPRIAKACKMLNKYWKIKAIPGAEITHVPLEIIPKLVKYARSLGARIVIGHGETVTEPVLKGTNRAYIKARVNLLAHPGLITKEDVLLAKKNNVYLELTSRKGHSKTNRHVAKMAKKYGALLVLNNDAHEPKNLINMKKRNTLVKGIGLNNIDLDHIIRNSVNIAKI